MCCFQDFLASDQTSWLDIELSIGQSGKMWATESSNQSTYSSPPIHRNSNVIHVQSHQLHRTTDEACEDTTIRPGSLKFLPAEIYSNIL